MSDGISRRYYVYFAGGEKLCVRAKNVGHAYQVAGDWMYEQKLDWRIVRIEQLIWG